MAGLIACIYAGVGVWVWVFTNQVVGKRLGMGMEMAEYGIRLNFAFVRYTIQTHSFLLSARSGP
jgi:hypothetical protein